MKRLILIIILLLPLITFSQVSSYVYSETGGTYAAISGGTQLVTTTGGAITYDIDGSYFTLPSGSQFSFNGFNITSVNMTADGAVWLNPGTTTTGNGVTGAIASAGNASGIICAMNMDLRSTALATQVYERRWQDDGTEIIFQWQNAARYLQSTVERFSFQIRINKSTRVVRIIYGNMTTIANSTTYQPIVGLRGLVNSDYNNRRLTSTVPDATPNWGAPNGTTAGTSNAHTVRFTSNGTCYPVSGLIFVWTPTFPANDLCANASLLTLQCPGSTTPTNGTSILASEESIPKPTCDNVGNIRDVWYYFSTGNNTQVNITAALGTASWIGVEIYTSCGTLATGLSPVCDFNLLSPNPTTITGFSMNTTYRLRIFTNVTYDTPGTFSIYLNTVNNTNSLTSLAATINQTICLGSPITNITYTTTGATGSSFSNLPSGVSGSWIDNLSTISGTPSVSGTYLYTMTLTGGCGTSTTTGSITVNPLVSTPSTITGNSNIIAGTSETYSIPTDPNATAYQWDYRESSSSPWVTNISSTTSATVNWPLTTTNGEVLVTISNGCGSQNKNLLISVDGVLPIELLYFSGTEYPTYNLLRWATASEHISDYFEIQESLDGISWKPVGIESGAGNSNSLIYYSYSVSFDGYVIHYYRLKQVDYDGNFEIFDIIALNNTRSYKKVVKYVNVIGQEVGPDTNGIIFEIYEDGSIKKVIK